MANYDYCLIGSATDVGRVRKANEDRCAWFDTDNGRIGVVCDGMGGHVGGQIASQTAIDAIKEYLNTHIIVSPQEAISNSITYANQAILQRASVQPELTGMGSTCVMLLIRDGRVYYGHVGDSRIYIISSRIIRQLTKDHSFVQMLVDAGQITAEQAEHHPRKNEITNALGLPNMQPPTVCSEPIEPDAGTAFLLCSDGLTGMVNDRTIEKVVSNRSVARLDDRAGELVHLANEAGGVDNISVLLVEFALGINDILSNDEPKTNKAKPKIIAIISCIVIIISFSCWYGYKYVYSKSEDESGSNKDKIETNVNIADTDSTLHFHKKPTTEKKDLGVICFEKNKTDVLISLPTGIASNYKIDQKRVDIQAPYNKSLKCVGVNDEKNELIIKRESTFDDISKPLIICVNLDSIKFSLMYKVEFKEILGQTDDKGKKETGKGQDGTNVDPQAASELGNLATTLGSVTTGDNDTGDNNTHHKSEITYLKYDVSYKCGEEVVVKIDKKISNEEIHLNNEYNEYISSLIVENGNIILKWTDKPCTIELITADLTNDDLRYQLKLTVKYPDSSRGVDDKKPQE